MMGFPPLVGDDTNIAEGSSGEGVDSTYSNLIKFTVFFWCRHSSLLSGVSVESPCPSLLHGWDYCCNSKIMPREVWSWVLPSYNCNFLIVFMIGFILPGKVLAPIWPSRTYLGFFFWAYGPSDCWSRLTKDLFCSQISQPALWLPSPR